VKKGYRLLTATTLDIVKLGLFPIKDVVSKLTYRIKLPVYIKMHPVISITHLEPAISDPLKRTRPPPGPVTDKDTTIGKKFNVDRIIAKEMRKMPRDAKVQ